MRRILLLSTLAVARLSFAEPPTPEASASPTAPAAETVVRRQVLQPLAASEGARSRFSRARLPAQERRVRILDAQAQKDRAGDAFFHFAIDARHGEELLGDDDGPSWRMAVITGCVYPARGAVFVKNGDRHRPAAFLLGKKVAATDEPVCQGAAPQLAEAK